MTQLLKYLALWLWRIIRLIIIFAIAAFVLSIAFGIIMSKKNTQTPTLKEFKNAKK